jgi:uncharacterized protein YfaT (DUF1175 family)
MSERKGPAFAGLFFALSILCPLHAADLPQLAASDQQYFRHFIEVFTPTLLSRGKKTDADSAKAHSASHYRPSAAAGQSTDHYRWDKKNRDCAGLVRYLFWEAMQPHNDAFLQQYPAMRSFPPNPPASLLRLKPAWSQDNLNAAQLIGRSRPVGRGMPVNSLKTGDLLYFQSAELKIRHVMLVVRSGASVFLVYHTGDDRDELRIRTFADISALPEGHWHPEVQNPVFRGVYRPQFLD